MKTCTCENERNTNRDESCSTHGRCKCHTKSAALDVLREKGIMGKVAALEAMDVNADAVISNLEGIPGVAEILEQDQLAPHDDELLDEDLSALPPSITPRARRALIGEQPFLKGKPVNRELKFEQVTAEPLPEPSAPPGSPER